MSKVPRYLTSKPTSFNHSVTDDQKCFDFKPQISFEGYKWISKFQKILSKNKEISVSDMPPGV